MQALTISFVVGEKECLAHLDRSSNESRQTDFFETAERNLHQKNWVHPARCCEEIQRPYHAIDSYPIGR